ncbi:hypothetical protein [Mycobacterium sp. E3198]|uniref:hypothetical protein n=1 Tax=Mycobacterium sp. E3198 TaxID=1834143 RepID=UPI000ACD7E57|nr:hypothetical protein [Mycobacterium sp. E3198]
MCKPVGPLMPRSGLDGGFSSIALGETPPGTAEHPVAQLLAVPLFHASGMFERRYVSHH